MTHQDQTATTPTQMTDSLMTPDELGDYLQIPKATIYKWHSEHRGPTAIKIGKHLRFLRTDIDAWLRSRADAK